MPDNDTTRRPGRPHKEQTPDKEQSSVLDALRAGATHDTDLNVPAAARTAALQQLQEQDDPLMSLGAPDQGSAPAQRTVVGGAEAAVLAAAAVATDDSADYEDISEALKRDYTSIAKEDLPEVPAGYEFRLMLEGKSYKRRLIATEDHVPAYEINAQYQDMLYVDEAARHRGIYAEMDFRWLNPRNEPDMRMSTEYGFVAVTEQIDKRYRLEGGKVVNGDLYLAMRPKQVTYERAVALERANKDFQQAEYDSYLDQDVDPKYGVASADVSMTHGDNGVFSIKDDSRRRAQERERNIAEQLGARRKDKERGKKVYSMNAPFQKTIIGGRVMDIGGNHPLAGAVGGS